MCPYLGVRWQLLPADDLVHPRQRAAGPVPPAQGRLPPGQVRGHLGQVLQHVRTK